MATKSKVLEVPWIGPDLVDYVGGWNQDKIIWLPNEPFMAMLKLEGYTRGRSAAQFKWKHVITGGTMNMFMTDMTDLLQNNTLHCGAILTTWIIKKRGSNYGIAQVK